MMNVHKLKHGIIILFCMFFLLSVSLLCWAHIFIEHEGSCLRSVRSVPFTKIYQINSLPV
jgi:hypothetical protein